MSGFEISAAADSDIKGDGRGQPLWGGLGVRVTSFGSDGWEDGDRNWYEGAEHPNQQSLGQFLASSSLYPPMRPRPSHRTFSAPGPTNGDPVAANEKPRGSIGSGSFFASLAIMFVLACLAIALLIWLFCHLSFASTTGASPGRSSGKHALERCAIRRLAVRG